MQTSFTGELPVNVNNKRRCSGCKKNQDEQMFIDEKTVRATCSNCRSNNKMCKKRSRDPLQSENEENEIFEKQLIEFEELTDELLFAMDQYTNIIIEAVQNADEYKWNTLKPSRKNPNLNKQRDTAPRERFDCNGTIKLLINTSIHRAYIHIQHHDLHITPTDFSYKRKDDAYDSAHDWLYEKGYEIIVINKEPARALGFTTGFHKELQEKNIQINECGIDATYNTNNLTFELYVLHAEVDGTGYPLGYLFLDNNGNGVSGARTNVIAKFLEEFRARGISPQFFLTDKDFAQISAGQTVWPNAKIQLCHWHLRRAVETKLKETHLPKRDNYEPMAAHHEFPFIDIKFNPSNAAYKSTNFCPKEFRPYIWNLMNKHLHQHPLIPDISQQILTAETIRKQAVLEMYTFCKENSLVRVWSYMWREWYSKDRWILWARLAFNTLSIFKTTMFVEGHWKVLKRDFLYKFFRPRLDLLVYILLEKLIPHQQRKFQQQLSGREMLDWKKSIKSEWKKLAQKQPEINSFNKYCTNIKDWVYITQQTLNLLEEQKQSRNVLWAQGVERNFNQIKTMVNEINQYKRRKTMPRTWKDHTHNTRYLR
ncbi:13551_t:CDS:2 [Funneliformis geosporum]|nr:13551_t:CDS:2 [Funneliformis geosporum]